MRRMLVAGMLVVPVMLACVTVAPIQQRALGPVAPDSAYGCALAQVDHLGYTLTASDRASGFLTAERRYTRRVAYAARDVLSVAISRQSGGQTEVHVTGTSDLANREGVLGPTGPTDQVTADAAAISKTCSGGAAGA